MRTEIRLSQTATSQIEEILSSGSDVQIAVRNGHLIIWKVSNKKEYDVIVAKPH